MTDLYQINMMYAHYRSGRMQQEAVFDLYYRTNPGGNGYAVAAGLEQVIEYIHNLVFSDEDIDYLQNVGQYEGGFLEELRRFRFRGDLWAIPEGTVIFPQEPLIRMKGTMFEAHLVETALLNIVNHQTLIATKASRIMEAVDHGDIVMEFGLRRAQGPDAGLYGTRACFIGGVHATSNVLAGKQFGIPVRGTHAHAYVQSFPSELEAFRTFAETFPDNAVLLVDTYNTLRSGIPNAIRVFSELVGKLGREPKVFGIRLDSGDLAYLSKRAREMLDEAGFANARIVASSDLDEFLIRDLKTQGARIDTWGVGTNLITSKDCPVLGGVFKMVAEKENGQWKPRIKISENPAKVTLPGIKKVVRFIDRSTAKPLVDLIMLDDEPTPAGEELEVFDPIETWKRKIVRNYNAVELLVPVFLGGSLVYQCPDLLSIRERTKEQISRFSPEVRRLKNPHIYHVDWSQELWDMKQELLNRMNGKA